MSKDGFKQSGNSPTQSKGPDFIVENHGSIFLLQPLTPAANSWVEENLPEGHMTFGGSVVVEHRYIGDIVQGIQSDGLAVR